MSGGQIVCIEPLAARGQRSCFVEAGNPMRRNLCLGRSFIRRERGMFFVDAKMPIRCDRCLLGVYARRLSIGGCHFAFLGENGGLSAGRK